jgi:hypothetical protein
MARPDEIRAAARASLKTYKADPNYLYVVKHYEDFSPKTREKLYIDNILGYVSGLERYIQEDKLVDMRRHEKPERYTPSFEECVKKMRTMPQETVQLSFFLGTTGNAVKHDSGDFEMD